MSITKLSELSLPKQQRITTSLTNHVSQEHIHFKQTVDFQVMVRNFKKFLENRNELFQVGSIGNKAGAKIEIEDVSALAFNS